MQLTEKEIKEMVATIERDNKENDRLKIQLEEGCKHHWPPRGIYEAYHEGDRRYCTKCGTVQIWNGTYKCWQFLPRVYNANTGVERQLDI